MKILLRNIFLMLIIFVAICGCKRNDGPMPVNPCDTGPILMFKFKDTSYIRLLRICIDTNTGNLSPSYYQYKKQINGYCVNVGNPFPNVITSVLFSDFQKVVANAQAQGHGISKGYVDSLRQKIIDWHPYNELYSVCLCSGGGDSVYLSNLIIYNQLSSRCGKVQLP